MENGDLYSSFARTWVQQGWFLGRATRGWAVRNKVLFVCREFHSAVFFCAARKGGRAVPSVARPLKATTCLAGAEECPLFWLERQLGRGQEVISLERFAAALSAAERPAVQHTGGCRIPSWASGQALPAPAALYHMGADLPATASSAVSVLTAPGALAAVRRSPRRRSHGGELRHCQVQSCTHYIGRESRFP